MMYMYNINIEEKNTNMNMIYYAKRIVGKRTGTGTAISEMENSRNFHLSYMTKIIMVISIIELGTS